MQVSSVQQLASATGFVPNGDAEICLQLPGTITNIRFREVRLYHIAMLSMLTNIERIKILNFSIKSSERLVNFPLLAKYKIQVILDHSQIFWLDSIAASA